MASTKLFISYSLNYRPDAVGRMIDYLRKDYEICTPKNNLTEMADEVDAVMKGIKASDIFLCFFSEAYAKSVDSMRQLRYAVMLEKKVFPIQVERDCEPFNWLNMVIGDNIQVNYCEGDSVQKASKKIIMLINANVADHRTSLASNAELKLTNKLHWTALHSACEHGHIDIVMGLVEKAPYIINIQDNDGWTGLHYACEFGHRDIVSFLVEKAPQLVHITTSGGLTALHFATVNGHLGIVEYLFEKAPELIKLRKNDGDTVMHIASANGHLGIVKILFDKEPQLVNTTDNFGLTSLHWACWHGHLDVVQCLTDKAPQLLSVTNNIGLTALHYAASYGFLDIAKFLLEKAPQLIKVKDKNGKSALHCASEHGHPAIATFLREKIPELGQILRKQEIRLKQSSFKMKTDALKNETTDSQTVKKLFFSYSWSVRPRAVRDLAKYLQETSGFRVWIDTKDMTGNSFEAMPKGINEAQVVLCFFSNAYVISDNCKRELDYAANTGKVIVPIRVEKGYQPNARLLFIFGGETPIDFFEENQFENVATYISKRLAS